eukprot:403335709
MSAFTIQRLYQSLYNTTHNKILCVGRNYVAHAKELNNPLPKEPLFFDKPHSSVIRSGEVLYLPRNNEIHHEVELGVMISMTGKNIKAKDWEDYIEGYFVGIDFTDRDLQNTAKKNGSPWFLSKGQDGFFAVSGFVPRENVRNPHDLDLGLMINQKYVQRDNTRHMIFQIPQLIEYISKYTTLHQGDIILTGTPSGVGAVSPGDFVEATLTQQGDRLANIYMKIEKGY